jgi:hypothetical protein
MKLNQGDDVPPPKKKKKTLLLKKMIQLIFSDEINIDIL